MTAAGYHELVGVIAAALGVGVGAGQAFLGDGGRATVGGDGRRVVDGRDANVDGRVAVPPCRR